MDKLRSEMSGHFARPSAEDTNAPYQRRVDAIWQEMDRYAEENTDCSAGGARYNASGIAPVGFATLTDSLYAVQVAAYEEQWVTLAELREALKADWVGWEGLQA